MQSDLFKRRRSSAKERLIHRKVLIGKSCSSQIPLSTPPSSPPPPPHPCMLKNFRTPILLLRRCPNSDGDDSRAPALCLICGEMLCSQSYCCQTEVEGDKVGACAAHALKCGAGVGVFLRVRECQILLMTNKNKGCFYSPPYLDAYGETDQGLRW